MNPVTLIPYDPSWFTVLQSWITDKHVLLHYSGTHFQYPLTAAQMDAYLLEFPERKMYMGLLNNEAFAFGEIIPQDERSVRLARILVGNPGLRGQGLGLAFVKALVTEARDLFEHPVIELFVFSTNMKAISCYSKAGFQFIPGADQILSVEGSSFIVQKMALRLR